MCVFFADTPQFPLAGCAFDLTLGSPAFGPEFLIQPQPRLWADYLHVRLVWEAAGNPARAQDLDADILSGLSAENDAGLERALNRHADEGFSLLEPDLGKR